MRPCIGRPGVLVAAALVVSALVLVPACGGANSGGSSAAGSGSASNSTAVSAATETSRFPARLSAVMGRYSREGQQGLWRLTPSGYAHKEITGDYVAGAGRVGALLAYSHNGELCLWHPDKASPQDVSVIAVPSAGASSADVIALSPDERRLALVRYAVDTITDSRVDQAVVHGAYLIDLPSGQVERWSWLEEKTRASGMWGLVTALRWSDMADVLYVSLGPAGGSQGEVSFRYDPLSGEAQELKGMACVLDINPQGDVLGLARPASPEEFDYPAGGQYGTFPLALWRNGVRTLLPRDPSVGEPSFAWISDEGNIIVVQAGIWEGPSVTSGLEVLKLTSAGWQVHWVYGKEEPLYPVYGVGFEPGTNIFCFQADPRPTNRDEPVVGTHLYQMETDLRQVYEPPLALPFSAEDYVHVLAIAGRGQD